MLGREWIHELIKIKSTNCSFLSILQIDSKSTNLKDKEKYVKSLEKYPNIISQNLTKINKLKAKLVLKTRAKAVFMKPRSLPFKLVSLDREFDSLVKQRVLEKVDTAEKVEYATPIMPILKKDGSVADLRRLQCDREPTVRNR